MGAPSYYPPAIGDFDGAADYLKRASDLTGSADGKVFTTSFWMRIDSGDGTVRQILSNATSAPSITIDFNNKIKTVTREPGTAVICNHTTDAAFLASSSWHHVLIAIDQGNDVLQVYVDDSIESTTGAALVDADIDMAGSGWSLGAVFFIDRFFPGAISEFYFTQEYIDLSIESNRRKFISSSGYPVDLGPSGYKPTGTAPIVYMRTPFNNCGLNSGTGGDFVINGSPSYTTGPVSVYNPTYSNVGTAPFTAQTYSNVPAPSGYIYNPIYTNELSAGNIGVDYDGAADYLSRGSDFAGNADSKVGIFSGWFRFDGGNGTARVLLRNNTNSIQIHLSASNVFRLAFQDVPNDTIFDLRSTSTLTIGSSWRHIIASWNLATGATHLFLDDSDDENEIASENKEIDYTAGAWAAAAHTTGADKFNGAIAEMYVNFAEYIDLSVESNRRKFISAAGKPVDLGPSGYKPTGTAPIIYMKSPANNAGLNSGTGGDFVINGAPTATAGPNPILPTFWSPSSHTRGRGGK